MKQFSRAEDLLKELGISDPKEIDLPAIAHYLSAKVKICHLDGCEARIIGYQDKAIIRVSDAVTHRRRRFSIAHEIGHWCLHRGAPLLCMAQDIGNPTNGASPKERVADKFAADLILPWYLLKPIARKFSKLDFNTVRSVADAFDVSNTSTAIRLIDMRHSPSLLICHDRSGRRWFKRCMDVPEHWFPRDELDHESYSFGLLFGNVAEQAHARKIGADAWFDRSGADRFEVYEHSIRIGEGKILALVTLTDRRMLEEA